MSTTRQRAGQRLTQIHAQMYALGEEAKELAGYLNGAGMEDQEKAQAAEAEAKEAKKPELVKNETPETGKKDTPAEAKNSNLPSVAK